MNSLQVKSIYPELSLPLDDKDLTEFLLDCYFDAMWLADAWRDDYDYSSRSEIPSHQEFFEDGEVDSLLNEITAQEIYGLAFHDIELSNEEEMDAWHENQAIYIEALIVDIQKIVQHYHLLFDDQYNGGITNMPVQEVW